MKNLLKVALVALFATSAAFGCPVTFINDTNNTIFAFDEMYNEGNILAPGKQHIYGNEGRHPAVTFYVLIPNGDTYKKSYRIVQKQCALYPSDKIISLTAAINGEISQEIYVVTNFALNPEVPPCCMHEGGEHTMDEPINTMEEE